MALSYLYINTKNPWPENPSEELLDSKMGKSDVRGLVNRITGLSARMRDV